jgi:hypothetical protein
VCAGSLVDLYMQDAFLGSRATFRPTWQQALARGVYLGAMTSVVALTVTLIVVGVELAATDAALPPALLWAAVAFCPPLAGAVGGVLVGRRVGIDIDAGGIHLQPGFTHAVEPWDQVVDLRAERRGGRTVVSVYLESGAAVRLPAPYDGEFLAADPQFESKLFALSQLWRSHRFGGLPG